jgi:hypothetical protein
MILANADNLKIGNDSFPRVQAIFSGESLEWERVAETSVLTYQINGSNDAYSVTGVDNTFESQETIALQGYLTIPSTYLGLPVTAIADGNSLSEIPFYNESRIRGVTIPTSITSIGNQAFYLSSNITRMVLHNGITSIGYNAFGGLSKLSSISLPSGLTELDTGLLSGCTSLTSITIPSGITTIGASVFNGTSISSITIPSLVNSIGNSTFASCTSLTSITIPNSVTLLGRDLFNGCSALTSATLGSGITEIRERTFFNCTSLSTINCLATTAPTLEDTNAFGNVSATEFHVPTGATGYSATYGGLDVVKDL